MSLPIRILVLACALAAALVHAAPVAVRRQERCCAALTDCLRPSLGWISPAGVAKLKEAVSSGHSLVSSAVHGDAYTQPDDTRLDSLEAGLRVVNNNISPAHQPPKTHHHHQSIKCTTRVRAPRSVALERGLESLGLEKDRHFAMDDDDDVCSHSRVTIGPAALSVNTDTGDMFSGKTPDVLSGNRPDSLTGNRHYALSGNRPDSLTGNRPDALTVNASEALAKLPLSNANNDLKSHPSNAGNDLKSHPSNEGDLIKNHLSLTRNDHKNSHNDPLADIDNGLAGVAVDGWLEDVSLASEVSLEPAADEGQDRREYCFLDDELSQSVLALGMSLYEGNLKKEN